MSDTPRAWNVTAGKHIYHVYGHAADVGAWFGARRIEVTDVQKATAEDVAGNEYTDLEDME